MPRDGNFMPRKGGPSRDSVRHVSDATIDRWLSGGAVPPARILFRAFYGADFSRIMARAYGVRRNQIYQREFPRRRVFERIIQAWEDPELRRHWEAHQLAQFNRDLARRRDRRAAVARWCRLILSDWDKS